MNGIPKTLCLATLLLSGCSRTDDVPAYIEIPAFGMTTSPNEGAPSTKITEAWVTVNGSFVGVWELPARLPALAQGSVSVELVPAIRRNGVFEDRLRYPFYTTWTGSATLSPSTTTTLAPTTSYRSNLAFWLEPFDAAGTLLATASSDDTLLIFREETDPLLVRDGSPVGGVRLSSTNPNARLLTNEDFGPGAGPVFLEMDYSTDVDLKILLRYDQNGLATEEPYVTLVPTTGNGAFPVWNKAYIDLSVMFNTAFVTNRDIQFDVSLGNGQASGLVLLDNLKIVQFE